MIPSPSRRGLGSIASAPETPRARHSPLPSSTPASVPAQTTSSASLTRSSRPHRKHWRTTAGKAMMMLFASCQKMVSILTVVMRRVCGKLVSVRTEEPSLNKYPYERQPPPLAFSVLCSVLLHSSYIMNSERAHTFYVICPRLLMQCQAYVKSMGLWTLDVETVCFKRNICLFAYQNKEYLDISQFAYIPEVYSKLHLKNMIVETWCLHVTLVSCCLLCLVVPLTCSEAEDHYSVWKKKKKKA